MDNGETLVVNKKRIFKIASIFVIILILISAWYFVNQIYTKKSIANNKESSLVHIRMVRPLWPGYMVSALANELGYFKDEGIQIDYVNPPDDADMLDELSAGNTDVQGTLSTQYLSHARKNGKIDSRIVLLTDYSNGGDALIARKDAPDLKSSKKKKIAGLQDYEFFLPYTLGLIGASNESIEFVDIVSDQERVDKILSGEIDYAATYDPFLTKAVDAGAKVVFSSGDKPGVMTDVLLFSNRLIKENPVIVRKFVKAYFKAYDFWRNNPHQAYKIVYDYYKYTPDEFDKQMSRLKLLSLQDNINAMSVNAGFNSIYGNLQTEQMFLQNRNGGIMYPVESLVYPNVLRDLSRDLKQ